MTGSFPIPPTHVAILHRKPVGYHFCVGALAGGSNSRQSLAGSTSQNVIKILPAPSIRLAVLPPQAGGLARGLSNISNHVARLGPSLIQRGSHWICNFGGAITRRSASLPNLTFRTLLKHCQEPRSVSEILISPFHSAEPLFLGLVALSERTQSSERKKSCPTRGGSNLT